MTKKDLLNKYYDMACHNLFCYSKNYGMTEPKEGFEANWKEVQEEVQLLEAMIKEEEKKEAAPEVQVPEQHKKQFIPEDSNGICTIIEGGQKPY